MASNFGSKEVEKRLMRGLSTDSPHTVFGDCYNQSRFVCWTKNVHVKLLKMNVLNCVENNMLIHGI